MILISKLIKFLGLTVNVLGSLCVGQADPLEGKAKIYDQKKWTGEGKRKRVEKDTLFVQG